MWVQSMERKISMNLGKDGHRIRDNSNLVYSEISSGGGFHCMSAFQLEVLSTTNQQIHLAVDVLHINIFTFYLLIRG